MATQEELRSVVVALRDEIDALADVENISAEDDLRLSVAIEEFDARSEELSAMELRAAKVAEVRASSTTETVGYDAPHVLKKSNPLEGDIRSASRGELRDRALEALEIHGKKLASHQLDNVEKLLRSTGDMCDGSSIARRLLVTESDAYRSGFQKSVTQDKPAYTPEEVHALNEFRAANEGTSSAGGYGVPILIDPTIILTSGAVNAPIVDISRVVTVTTNTWKGVSSAGMSWSYDAEASAVSDDAATLAQPSITVYSSRGFIPYSIEIGQDYPGFADEMGNLLAQGYIDQLASTTVVGTGSSQPYGIFTRMNATLTAPAHVTTATAGSLGAVDIRKAWAALPQRYRANASWVMSPTAMSQVRAFGNGNALSDFTVNLLADGTDQLTGRPVITSDYAPAFTGATATTTSIAVVGDFSNFVIAQRAGMEIELINNLFDQSTGRPSGQRGWFAFARHGMDAANVNGFRIITVG